MAQGLRVKSVVSDKWEGGRLRSMHTSRAARIELGSGTMFLPSQCLQSSLSGKNGDSPYRSPHRLLEHARSHVPSHGRRKSGENHARDHETQAHQRSGGAQPPQGSWREEPRLQPVHEWDVNQIGSPSERAQVLHPCQCPCQHAVWTQEHAAQECQRDEQGQACRGVVAKGGQQQRVRATKRC